MTSLEQIRKLEKTLSTNEAYINNLEKAISGRDEEISDQAEELELLRKNNSDLQKRLKKALADIEHKEESLVILDNRINELQEEITALKNRIQDITSRKKLAMAQAPNANEVQTLGESVRNAFNTINSILRRVPAIPRNLEGEFTDIRNAVDRLQHIADREKNRADRAQAQVDQKNQDIRRLNTGITQAEGDYGMMLLAYHNEKNERRHWFYSYKDKHRRVGGLLREKFAYKFLFRQYAKKLKECQDHGKVLDFKLNSIEKAKDKQLVQKHFSEWDYKTREAKGLTIKVPMPNSPDISSSFYSDSSDTGSLTGGMRQKFDIIHRHSRRTGDILDDIEEELHSSDSSENSSNSIIIEGTSNTDIPPLFNDSSSSSSDDEEIQSLSSSDDDIHARCRQIHIQNIRLRRKAEQDLQKCHNERALLEFNRDRLVNELEIAEDDIIDQNQIINILQQQILVLQNNPQNMATPIECSNIIAPSLANIPEFIGQEHPETWIERITKLFLHPIIAGNGNFTDAHKVSVLSSKMGGPYYPVPAQNAYVHPAVNIDTPAHFNTWLLSKYAEENVGGMTMGIQALLGEKFSPFDTPESYRDRIRKISIGVTDAIAVPILFQQLPPDLVISVRMYMNDRGAGNQTVANFFADLKRAYIEIRGGVGKPQVPSQVTNTPTLQNKPPPLPPGHEYRLDEFHTNRFLDDVAKKQDPNYSDNYPGTQMGSPLPARFLNPIAERKFKLADRIKQSAYAEEKRLQDPENIDAYINDELSSLYGQKMSLGGVRKNPPKRRSHKKKPVKGRGKGRKKRVGAINTVDDSYYPENSSDNSEDDSEDDTEDEEEEETNYGLIGGVRKKK